jgi:hypothetical protein
MSFTLLSKASIFDRINPNKGKIAPEIVEASKQRKMQQFPLLLYIKSLFTSDQKSVGPML